MRTSFIKNILFLALIFVTILVTFVNSIWSDQNGQPTLQSEIVLLPTHISLNGPHASQKLIVEAKAGDKYKYVADLTAQATFTSSNPQVAKVENDGILKPVGDGTATITAAVGEKKATATVEVKNTQTPFVWSFRNQVIPVMTKSGCNSGACHGALAGKGGLKLTLRGYDPLVDHAVLTRQALGRRIVKTEPAKSLMLLKPTLAIQHGGGQRFKVDSDEYRIISEWIASGTPTPTDKDPIIQGLEVFPNEAMLQAGDTQQVIVRARFSDNHLEDVTRWAKYNTSDSIVASVSDEGRVKVQSSGEAAITVWYMSKVAFARISVPYKNEIRSEVFAKAPRYNFIDEIVLKKLQALAVPPSELCSDSEFIRRAYLDAAGILPTPEEVERFLADASPSHVKRSKLIESLLERSEFVDYWAYKWSDLLLVSSRKLPSRAMWAFYNWLRESVAQNKPWDQFAKELITATGSTLQNGAANYFVLHKDPIDLTETTSQAFLGMSITCSRCHNHPLEKWTLSDYYGMANLFARVAMKNGDVGGEVLVFPAVVGNINHPRLGKPLPPRPLEGQEIPLEAPEDRRFHLAQWLTDPQNPYFARAIVNRIWRNFMGRGLVEAEDDLRFTNPPSNEELLAMLAKDFVAHKFDVKYLIKMVMNSATYQLSSTSNAQNADDQKYYSHYIIKRLPAEVMLDAISQVTGIPTEFAGYPKGYRALQLPDSRVDSYFLNAFGRPQRVQTCSCERQQEPSIAQALHLSNGNTINEKLKGKDGTIDKLIEKSVSNEEAINALYLSALSRYPVPEEREKLLALLSETTKAEEEKAEGEGRKAEFKEEKQEEKQKDDPRRQAIEDLFWATLTSREFLFNH